MLCTLLASSLVSILIGMLTREMALKYCVFMSTMSTIESLKKDIVFSCSTTITHSCVFLLISECFNMS